jgi:LacI family transcriptional regulator
MFRRNGGRVAAIGRHHLGVDAVRPDNVAGGESIARHIVDLGHRRIAIATGSPALTTVADRLQGIHRVLDEHEIEAQHRPVIEVPFTLRGGRAAGERILDEHPEVTAILALNDAMAIGLLSALRAQQVDVPGRISVAGFDDVAVASSLAPSLTTVRIPMAEFGRRALELATSEPSGRTRQRRTDHELIVRDSTATPRPRD